MEANQVIDITKFEEQLKNFDALRDTDEIQTGILPHIQPQSADVWPAELDTSVRNVLNNIGIQSPYQHQAEANSKSLSGADVVLESPPASGKTLAFTAPMLDLSLIHI